MDVREKHGLQREEMRDEVRREELRDEVRREEIRDEIRREELRDEVRREELRDEVRREELRDEIRYREIHEERYEERYDDYWDYWDHRRHRVAVGTVYEVSDFDDEYCEATVVVDRVTYYSCDGVWYRQAYSGGTVNYIVVGGPRSD